MTDVLIAGAGVRCRLIDKAGAPATTSRALGVQARTLECFEQLGISDRAVRLGLPLPGIRLHSDRKLVAHVAFQQTPSPLKALLEMVMYVESSYHPRSFALSSFRVFINEATVNL